MLKLVIPEMTFSASHYIPGHPKCGCIHGHTYFIRDLVIDVSRIPMDCISGYVVDFGEVKNCIKSQFDHKFFVYKSHAEIIRRILKILQLKDNLVEVGYSSAEELSKLIRDTLAKWISIEKGRISFKLFEGPKQGVAIS